MDAQEFVELAEETPGCAIWETRDGEPAAGGSFQWRELQKADSRDPDTDPTQVVVTCNVLAYGDYDNSTAVERSNVKAVEEMFDESEALVWMSHGHGSYAVGFVYDPEVAEEVIELLGALSDYPLVDDEAHSEMEMEMFEEAWNNFGASEFGDAVLRDMEHDSDAAEYAAEDFLGDIDPQTLFEAYDTLGEAWGTGCMMVEGGGTVHFDFEEPLRRAGGGEAVYEWLLERKGLGGNHGEWDVKHLLKR